MLIITNIDFVLVNRDSVCFAVCCCHYIPFSFKTLQVADRHDVYMHRQTKTDTLKTQS